MEIVGGTPHPTPGSFGTVIGWPFQPWLALPNSDHELPHPAHMELALLSEMETAPHPSRPLKLPLPVHSLTEIGEVRKRCASGVSVSRTLTGRNVVFRHWFQEIWEWVGYGERERECLVIWIKMNIFWYCGLSVTRMWRGCTSDYTHLTAQDWRIIDFDMWFSYTLYWNKNKNKNPWHLMWHVAVLTLEEWAGLQPFS